MSQKYVTQKSGGVAALRENHAVLVLWGCCVQKSETCWENRRSAEYMDTGSWGSRQEEGHCWELNQCVLFQVLPVSGKVEWGWASSKLRNHSMAFVQKNGQRGSPATGVRIKILNISITQSPHANLALW